jgi:hypothetical protein
VTQHESFQPRRPSRQPPFDDPRQPGNPPLTGPGMQGPSAGVPGPPPPGRYQGPPPRGRDEDIPPWAGLGPEGAPPQKSRGAASAARRKKRRVLQIGAAVGVVALAVGGYLIFGRSSRGPNVIPGDLVTTFLPGELQTVPNACTAVPAATLSRYLPGKTQMAWPPLNGGQDSQCSWTLDHAPIYRVVEVNIEAYTPSALATGDGSATFAAIDAYLAAQAAKQNPGPHSGAPKAQITTVNGLGNDAFYATQVFNTGGTVSDLVTEIVRYKNVLVTVVVNGEAKSVGGRRYGPVSMSYLTAAAQTVAQGAAAAVIH